MDHLKVWKSIERGAMDETFATVFATVAQLLAYVFGEMMRLHSVFIQINPCNHTEVLTQMHIITSQVNPAVFWVTLNHEQWVRWAEFTPLFLFHCMLFKEFSLHLCQSVYQRFHQEKLSYLNFGDKCHKSLSQIQFWQMLPTRVNQE